MTSARRAAIRKAQLASARKRRNRGRKRAALGVAAGVGVIGVTMAAANGYGNRRRARMAPKNVVEATVQPQIQYSNSKELDVFRVTFDDPGVVRRTNKGKYKGIDFSSVGKTYGEHYKTIELTGRENKLNTHVFGKGKIRVAGNGKAVKVKRDRQKFNEDRRNDYSPAARHDAYERSKARKARKKK